MDNNIDKHIDEHIFYLFESLRVAQAKVRELNNFFSSNTMFLDDLITNLEKSIFSYFGVESIDEIDLICDQKDIKNYIFFLQELKTLEDKLGMDRISLYEFHDWKLLIEDKYFK